MGLIRTRILALGPGVLLVILLVGAPSARALDPSLDVSQYAHTAWKIRDGFTKGEIHAIVQTPDGYIWLGTEFGLLRFDGVRAIPWQPQPNQHLPSEDIGSLLVASDGTLWIGTSKGLASWKDGKLTQYAELDGQYIFKLLQDHEGSVWTGSFGTPTGRLCAIRKGVAQCFGEDGSFGRAVIDLHEDHKGNLWVGAPKGLWRWRPGPRKFFPMPADLDSIRGFCEGEDGSILFGTRHGIRRLVDGKIEAYALPDTAQQVRAEQLFRDHDGSLWIGTFDQGLMHVHHGRTDRFALVDGLSGNAVASAGILEDREGNIWVATADGLDRFRDFAVATISVKQGVPGGSVWSVLAASDATVWLGTSFGLDKWSRGRITNFGGGDGKLNGEVPESLFQDSNGQIWVSTVDGIGHLQNNRFVSAGGISGKSVVRSIAGDAAGNLWLANLEHGLVQLHGGSVVQQIPWTKLGTKQFGNALISDPIDGGLWIGYWEGGLAYFKDGQVRASYAHSDGLGEGPVADLRLDRDGALWIATQGGLSRLKNGHIATLTSKNGLPCDSVQWMMDDDSHSEWLYMPCGLVRISGVDLEAWVNDPRRMIQATVFDSSDGVETHSDVHGYSPRVTKTADGELWFATPGGVSIIDPRHLETNKLPPPVHIEQVTADRKMYWQNSSGDASISQPKLPPLVRDLEIDYTALSLVAPEKNRFRYKLEGRDRDWQDVGNRRQAYYSDLPPGNYRFRVIASNNNGVWNEAGTSLDFSIAPAYYQTIWFRMMCVVAFLFLLWGLYQLRVRQLAREFNMGVEARVSERTRIARDLHDTLLQSFQGLLLRFQTVSQILPEGNAKQTLDSAIDQAAQAITEGRNAVQDLRSPTAETSDLAEAIRTLGEEIASVETNRSSIVFRVDVEGKPRNVHPILRDEIYRIAGEALRNAFNHAQASQIEVEIRYDDRQFRLRVRDDGKGIDPKVLGGNGRAGHFGLHGMRERAKLMGGNLAVWSELNSGTEVELSVPASNAYSSSSSGRTTGIFKKLVGKGTQVKS
jgi:signal transduction histidine kinase/ligand-binding sensor domain-containing protein